MNNSTFDDCKHIDVHRMLSNIVLESILMWLTYSQREKEKISIRPIVGRIVSFYLFSHNMQNTIINKKKKKKKHPSPNRDVFCFVIHKAESSLLSDVEEQVARFE